MTNIEQPQPVHCEYDDMRDLHTPMVMTPVNGIITNNNVNGTLGFKGLGKQTITQHLPPYLNANRTRQNSNSSLASSVSDFPMNTGYSLRKQALSNTPLNGSGSSNGGGQFSQQFISLLMEAYQVISMDPTVTPFDTMNPPSAILNRVAKLAIDTATERAIDIGFERNNWLLTLVRQRLLQEVRKDGYLSRNASLVSLPPAAPMFEMMNSNNTVFQPGNDGYGVDYFNYNFAQLSQASNNGNNMNSNDLNMNNNNVSPNNFVGTPTAGNDTMNLNFPNPSVITRQRSSTLSPLPSSLNIPEDSTLMIPDIFKRRMDCLKMKR
ncbi:hypothetical protein RNJ44_03686 [Nakaseomyces bracarensis]|uniref:Uncharacterized protein n=1 Tax=Nakaseomyces bracarensis TaxID=273131 RepID=A0ABR4NXN8_9SACH